MATVRAFLGGCVLEKVSKSLVGIFNPDQSRRHGFPGLEIIVDQQGAGLAGVDVFLVLRVGVET